jgi:hypothetical protein
VLLQFKVVKNPDRLLHVPNVELTHIDNTKLGVSRKGVASLHLQEKLAWSIQDEYITSYLAISQAQHERDSD